MKSKKTALEWFQMLPEPIRSQAVENWEKSDKLSKNDLFEFLHGSLDASFWWDLTPQGDNHWSKIYQQAQAGEFDKKLYGWIPVSERLPEEADGDKVGMVLIVTKMNTVSVAPIVWVIANNAICQFWQPLPKLPEVQDGNA